MVLAKSLLPKPLFAVCKAVNRPYNVHVTDRRYRLYPPVYQMTLRHQSKPNQQRRFIHILNLRQSDVPRQVPSQHAGGAEDYCELRVCACVAGPQQRIHLRLANVPRRSVPRGHILAHFRCNTCDCPAPAIR